jgi:hypothetical protein
VNKGIKGWGKRDKIYNILILAAAKIRQKISK